MSSKNRGSKIPFRYLLVLHRQPPDASGIESVLAGLRDAITDDDLLLQAASSVFDGLFNTFSKEVPAHASN